MSDERNGNGNGHFIHYASKYYDPVKAHEYYMKNRELKDRRSAKKLTKEGKEIWKYTKSNITAEKKRALDAEKQAHSLRMDGHRENGKIARDRIRNKLRETLKAISEKRAAKLERESEQSKKRLRKETHKLDEERKMTTKAIDRLMAEDYSDLPDSVKKKKIAERKKKVAKLRGDLKEESNETRDDKADIRDDTSSEKRKISKAASEQSSGERETTRAEREKLSLDLKNTLNMARDAYAAAKESIKQGFETTYNSEFDAIAAEYGTGDGGSSEKTYTPVKRSDAEKKKIRSDLYKKRTS